MQINTKTRYALAAMIHMAHNQNIHIKFSVSTIARNLGISKIYLEQIFSSLKKAHLVNSIKGPQGGYKLAKSIDKISVFDIIQTFDLIKIDDNLKIAIKKAPEIDAFINTNIISKINLLIVEYLKSISLGMLLEGLNSDKENMYYI